MTPVETVLVFSTLSIQTTRTRWPGGSQRTVFSSTRWAIPYRAVKKCGPPFALITPCVPDYRISREDIFHNGDTVDCSAALGTIRVNGELLPENTWQIPAAWRAVVRDSLIREWRVYTDNKPVYDILAKWAKPQAK